MNAPGAGTGVGFRPVRESGRPGDRDGVSADGLLLRTYNRRYAQVIGRAAPAPGRPAAACSSREELGVSTEQLAHLADEADDARLRALVSETPVSAREHREAERHAEAMRRHRADVADEIARLETNRTNCSTAFWQSRAQLDDVRADHPRRARLVNDDDRKERWPPAS